MGRQTASVSFHSRRRGLHIPGLAPVSQSAAFSEGFCATRSAREKLLNGYLSKPAKEATPTAFRKLYPVREFYDVLSPRELTGPQ